ncbi:MAG TPA: hypothetical protein VF549_16905 [Solirubrobacteraceae bacterium]|jgi:phage FluMu protein gp41
MSFDSTPPTVRGDLVVLTAGRRGTDEDTVAVAGAVLLDAAISGVIDVTGRRVVGIDRRRVVAGPREPADALMADLRCRLDAVSADTPQGWIERVNVFGEDAVARELIDAGVAQPREVPWWKRLVRHRTLDIVDQEAVAAAAARLHDATSPVGAATAIVLRETDMLGDVVGRRDGRRIMKAAERTLSALPNAVQAVAATLHEHRRRADAVGHYAD